MTSHPVTKEELEQIHTIPCIAIDKPTFSDVWEHRRHFVTVGADTVKLWGNLVVREFDNDGLPTNREMLCVVSYVDKNSLGIGDGFCIISLEVLHTSSEYCNHYGNCSVVLPKKHRPDPLEVLEKWIQTEKQKYDIELHGLPEHLRDKCLCLVSDSSTCGIILDVIKELKTNPDAVIARGKEEGWL